VLDCFSSDIRNRSSIQRAWDDARESIVESAYKTLLLPFFEHETRRELLRLAKDAIIEEATDAYAKLVSAGPFRPQRVKFQDAVESTPFKACFFSVACIYLPADTGRDSTVFMCYVDRDGLVRAQDSIPYEARNQKRTKIRDFLKMTRPEVIVVNAGAGHLSLSTQSLVEAFLVKEVNEILEAEAAARRRSRRHSEYYVEDEDEEEAKKFEPEVCLTFESSPSLDEL
jgi:transcriptional accessory protein Tex/SPT6